MIAIKNNFSTIKFWNVLWYEKKNDVSGNYQLMSVMVLERKFLNKYSIFLIMGIYHEVLHVLLNV